MKKIINKIIENTLFAAGMTVGGVLMDYFYYQTPFSLNKLVIMFVINIILYNLLTWVWSKFIDKK